MPVAVALPPPPAPTTTLPRPDVEAVFGSVFPTDEAPPTAPAEIFKVLLANRESRGVIRVKEAGDRELVFCTWRRPSSEGRGFEFRSAGVAPFPAALWFDVTRDLEYHSTWDATCLELTIEEEAGSPTKPGGRSETV